MSSYLAESVRKHLRMLKIDFWADWLPRLPAVCPFRDGVKWGKSTTVEFQQAPDAEQQPTQAGNISEEPVEIDNLNFRMARFVSTKN